MNYLIHATPVHLSLCLQYLILLFTIATITVFTLLLLLLFYNYHHYKTVAADKPLRASLFLGAAELTTHLLRLINILWLPLCRMNKFGFYFPRRLLRSPILVGHQSTTGCTNLWTWTKIPGTRVGPYLFWEGKGLTYDLTRDAWVYCHDVSQLMARSESDAHVAAVDQLLFQGCIHAYSI
jgi:hypothetical protein